MEVMNRKWKINLIWCIYNGIKRPGELHSRNANMQERMLKEIIAATGTLLKNLIALPKQMLPVINPPGAN
jgi:hypothetical protein